MENIWEIIAELGSELHPDQVSALAAEVESLKEAIELGRARPDLSFALNEDQLSMLAEAWERAPQMKPDELAAALHAASFTANLSGSRESVEMVWTGPSTQLVPCRHTEQALIQVVESAKKRLFVVSFVAYKVGSIITALQDASAKGVQIEMLLEASKDHGGNIDFDCFTPLVEQIPAGRFYRWDNDARDDIETKGSVHAKCAVADGKVAFITSANLTGAAMEKNMEVGVLIRNGDLPHRLDRHLRALIQTNVITQIDW